MPALRTRDTQFQSLHLNADSNRPTVVTPSPARVLMSKGHCNCSHRPTKGDDTYVKRPPNAFILFRTKCCEIRREEASRLTQGPVKKQRQADLSKAIGQQWKALSPEGRDYWFQLAREKKEDHQRKYPYNIHRPQRRPPKGRKGLNASRGQSTHERDSEHIMIDHATSPQFDIATLLQQFPSVDVNGVLEGAVDGSLQSLFIPPGTLMLQGRPFSSLPCPAPSPAECVGTAQIGDAPSLDIMSFGYDSECDWATFVVNEELGMRSGQDLAEDLHAGSVCWPAVAEGGRRPCTV